MDGGETSGHLEKTTVEAGGHQGRPTEGRQAAAALDTTTIRVGLGHRVLRPRPSASAARWAAAFSRMLASPANGPDQPRATALCSPREARECDANHGSSGTHWGSSPAAPCGA